MKRSVVLGGVLVVLIGISAYFWTRAPAEERDSRIASIKELFTCPHCGHQWEMTHEESTQMLMGGNGFICPSCGQSDAKKANPEFVMGGFGDPEPEHAEAAEEEPLPTANSGMSRVGD